MAPRAGFEPATLRLTDSSPLSFTESDLVGSSNKHGPVPSVRRRHQITPNVPNFEVGWAQFWAQFPGRSSRTISPISWVERSERPPSPYTGCRLYGGSGSRPSGRTATPETRPDGCRVVPDGLPINVLVICRFVPHTATMPCPYCARGVGVVCGVKTAGPDQVVLTFDCGSCHRRWTQPRASPSLRPTVSPAKPDQDKHDVH